MNSRTYFDGLQKIWSYIKIIKNRTHIGQNFEKLNPTRFNHVDRMQRKTSKTIKNHILNGSRSIGTALKRLHDRWGQNRYQKVFLYIPVHKTAMRGCSNDPLWSQQDDGPSWSPEPGASCTSASMCTMELHTQHDPHPTPKNTWLIIL